METNGKTIMLTSIKDVFIPIQAIIRVVHDRKSGYVKIWTDRGITTVLDDYAEIAAVIPNKCEEV